MENAFVSSFFDQNSSHSEPVHILTPCRGAALSFLKPNWFYARRRRGEAIITEHMSGILTLHSTYPGNGKSEFWTTSFSHLHRFKLQKQN